MRRLIIAIFCIAISLQLSAGKFDRTTIIPTQTDTPPILDGILNDDVWKNAKTVTDFITFMPDFGKDLSEKTIGYIAYDRDNLYFAFKCYDTEPNKIKASITARDNISDEDWVCVNLDTYNDQQSLSAFYVNPFGIQMDSRFMSGNEDASIDLVWYSSGKLNDEGYSVEIQIPLKSIRYSSGSPVEMGIFLERNISRSSEHGSYPELNPEKGYAMLTQLNPIVYHDLKKQTLLEILPAFTHSKRSSYKEGEMSTDFKKSDGHLTLKYGITSDLVLDATYNPDFSQIEADAGQVDINLRNSLFFSEKRPFFLEGNEIYKIGATQSSSNDPLRSIVHTRTIVNPIFGIKLAGKLGDKNNVLLLYAKDELPKIDGQNQFAHFPVFRYKRILNKDSYIGGIFTSRELENTYNRVGGLDGEVRLSPSSTLAFHSILSESQSILQDETLDINSGHSIGLTYWFSNRDIDYGLIFKDISTDFNVDMGYIKRTGMQIYAGYFKQKIYPKADFFNRIDGEIYTSAVNDKFYNMWEMFNYSAITIYFWGNAQFIAKYYLTNEIYLGERFKTNGFHTLLSKQITKGISAYTVLRWNNAIFYGDPHQGKTFKATGSITFQPSDKLSSQLSINYAQFRSNHNNEILYSYPLARLKLTYQLNKYLFFRGIGEYNGYYDNLVSDFLASFTYIPGTVIHLGYGSVYQNLGGDELCEINCRKLKLRERARGFFFKVSYLWRL